MGSSQSVLEVSKGALEYVANGGKRFDESNTVSCHKSAGGKSL